MSREKGACQSKKRSTDEGNSSGIGSVLYRPIYARTDIFSRFGKNAWALRNEHQQSIFSVVL